MRWSGGLWLFLGALLLAAAGPVDGSMGSARAQAVACAPQNPEHLPGWRSYMKSWGDWPIKEHAEEARRIGDNPDVLRYLDRLYFVIDEGYKLITFFDCPFNNAALFYLFEHFDEIGRFYVVKKAVHEDGPHYLLVSKEDGSSIEFSACRFGRQPRVVSSRAVAGQARARCRSSALPKTNLVLRGHSSSRATRAIAS